MIDGIDYKKVFLILSKVIKNHPNDYYLQYEIISDDKSEIQEIIDLLLKEEMIQLINSFENGLYQIKITKEGNDYYNKLEADEEINILNPLYESRQLKALKELSRGRNFLRGLNVIEENEIINTCVYLHKKGYCEKVINFTGNGEPTVSVRIDPITAEGLEYMQSLKEKEVEKKKMNNKNIFVVYGHNDTMNVSVENFIRTIRYNPIIFVNESEIGTETIISKLIRLTDEICYGIIIFSSDDYGLSQKDFNEKFLKTNNTEILEKRVRQNVLFECGYLAAKLNGNFTILYENEVSIPSDLNGVLYKKYDDPKGIWRNNICKNMEKVGLLVERSNL